MATDTHFRSLAKAISYRLVGTAITSSIVFAATGKPFLAAGIGLADAGIKIASYYRHERIWECTSFGRSRCPIPQGIAPRERNTFEVSREVIAR